jgi:hypothetical protein
MARHSTLDTWWVAPSAAPFTEIRSMPFTELSRPPTPFGACVRSRSVGEGRDEGTVTFCGREESC